MRATATPVRGSHIESGGRDRRLDTVVAHTGALGAGLLLALRVVDHVLQVNHPEGARIDLVQHR